SVPPEVWNRLGTKILPKLRSGSDLKIGLDSYLEDYRQEQFDIVTRPRAHRQCFGWLCRRGGMRLRAYCLDGGGGRAGCGNSCWQSVRRGVYGRTRTAAPLGPPWQ